MIRRIQSHVASGATLIILGLVLLVVCAVIAG